MSKGSKQKHATPKRQWQEPAELEPDDDGLDEFRRAEEAFYFKAEELADVERKRG